MKSLLVLLSALAMGCKPTSASVSEPAPSAASAAAVSETTPSKPVCEPLRVELPPLEHLDGDPPVPPVVDPNHRAMEPFYRRWAELLRGQAKDHLRIAVYGDSNGTMDFMTGAMRRALQGKYGDAGHGYVSIGQPWNWYRHRDVKVTLMTGTWESFTVTTKPVLDGFYGQALIMAESLQNGATAWISTADADAPVGTRATSLEVYFLRGPRGGVFDVMADGVRLATVDTSAKEHAAGFERVSVADGPHKFALVARSTKRVRIFGVVLEREPPSVQVDGLGVGSLNC
ncbi:MAG: hypothetical protein WCI05_15745, partial [Myxococcales bacterium]